MYGGDITFQTFFKNFLRHQPTLYITMLLATFFFQSINDLLHSLNQHPPHFNMNFLRKMRIKLVLILDNELGELIVNFLAVLFEIFFFKIFNACQHGFHARVSRNLARLNISKHCKSQGNHLICSPTALPSSP